VPPDIEYRDVIQPDEVITWVDVNGNERPMGPTSWANELEAKACIKISNHLSKIAPKKTKVIVTRFTAQKHIIRNYLQRMGDYSTKVKHWAHKQILSFFHWLEIIRREMLEQLAHYRILM
jgi:hypothetical protein